MHRQLYEQWHQWEDPKEQKVPPTGLPKLHQSIKQGVYLLVIT